MDLQKERDKLKRENQLDEKASETYFTINAVISDESKNKVQKDFKVYINPKKNEKNKYKVSGVDDKDIRLKAIINLLRANIKEEEEEFFTDDEDSEINDVFIKKYASNTSSDQPKKQEQPSQETQTSIQPETNESEKTDQSKQLHETNGRQQGRNPKNNRYRNNRDNQNSRQPRRTNSTPHENNQTQNRIQRIKSSDNPQPERKPRGPTQNYSRIHRNNNNNNHNNSGKDTQNENGIQAEQGQEGNDNQAIKELRNERDRGRFRGGRGRGGRGRGLGRNRGGHGARAPLGPRKSILDANGDPTKQNSEENAPIEVNQQQQQQHQHPNYRGNRYNNNNYYNNKRGNRQVRGGNRQIRGGKYGPRPNSTNQQDELQQNISQSPIPPENISFKEEVEVSNTIEITPELRHILMLMDSQITPESTDQEILENEWFHLEKLSNPLNEQDMQQGSLMNAPYLLVEFLIESFAIDQPEQFKHIEHKDFQEKQLMHLNMPFSMPLTFQTEGDKIQVGFFDLSDFSTENMNDLCSTVLTTLSQREMLDITIKEVDKLFSFAYLENLSKELDFVYLRSIPEENEEMETISFNIKIMKYNWSPEKEQTILNKINELFLNSSIYECNKCGCTYSPTDGSKCYLTRHKGKQIQFPDTGEMEVVDQDEETGQPIVYVYYECCGEVEQDEPGCEMTNIENGNHEPYNDGETQSTMSVNTLPIYS